MAFSDTARCSLTEAAQHPLRLAAPPDNVPVAAARVVLNKLLKPASAPACPTPSPPPVPSWSNQRRHRAPPARTNGARAPGSIRCSPCCAGRRVPPSP